MEKMKMLGLTVVIISFLTAFYAYPLLPEQIASHWGIDGNVNGHMPKTFGAFFMPVLAAALFALFIFLPKLDPLKENYKSFINEYNMMIALILGFMYYIFLLMLAFNFGYSFDMNQFLSPAFGILFYFLGSVISKAKQNWFVGIRTPWTMSSEKVWNKTHKICGDLFRAAGIVAMLGVVFPKYMLIASIGVVMASAVFGVAYSYLEFQKEKKKSKR